MRDHVMIREVGPREGLQSDPQIVPTETKVEIIRELLAAGIKSINAVALGADVVLVEDRQVSLIRSFDSYSLHRCLQLVVRNPAGSPIHQPDTDSSIGRQHAQPLDILAATQDLVV